MWTEQFYTSIYTVIFTCFVWISEQTSIISLDNADWFL